MEEHKLIAMMDGYVYGTNAVSSPRFPLYKVDFGCRKPSDVQITTMNEIRLMFLSCGKDGGKSILVYTCLPKHQMQVLHNLLFI